MFHCTIKGPQFPRHVIKMMTSNFHHVIKGSQFIIASSMDTHCDLFFPITLSRGSIYNGHQEAPISPIASSKGPKFPKYTMRYVLIKNCRKSYNRDKRVQSLSRGVGVCREGVKGIRLWSMGRVPGESVVHGPRTSSLRHWIRGSIFFKNKELSKKKKKKIGISPKTW